MLPRAGGSLPADGRHLYDPHWGGPRTLAYLEVGRVRLVAGGRDVTSAFPEVAAALVGAAPAGTILDGELVIPDAIGRLDRLAVRRRLRQQRGFLTATATFVVTDLPWLAGVPLVAQSLLTRRGRLDDLHVGRDHLVAPAPLVGEAAALLASIRTRRLDGLVAKRMDSPYLPGVRSRLWRLVRAAAVSVPDPADADEASMAWPLALLRSLPLGEEP